MIKFDYSLNLKKVESEKQNFNISTMDFYDLKREISNGKVFVIFDEVSCLSLDIGIIDCLIQFNDVVLTIDAGSEYAFSTSWDAYSNRINYIHNPNLGTLQIIEGHVEDYNITVNYKDFKKGFQRFCKRALEELPFYYPNLVDNKVYKAMQQGELLYDVLKKIE